MNVRITPRHQPQRTDLYGGIGHVASDGVVLTLYRRLPWLIERGLAHGHLREGLLTPPLSRVSPPTVLPLPTVAEIALDEEPGDWWG